MSKEELMSKFEPPMGISQWHKHGEKYGYSEYWKADIELKARLDELKRVLVPARLSGLKNVAKFCEDRIKELERV